MSGDIRIVLVETSHSGNVGASARAMKVMGLERLILVAPSCEISSEARARASGAEDLVRRARIVATLGEALVGVRFVVGTSARARQLGPERRLLREGVPELLGELERGDVAVVFGPERTGLDNEALDRCNRLWRIPASSGYESLNLAAAVQVVAYEILAARASFEPRPVRTPAAAAQDVAALCEHFDRTARAVGYVHRNAPRLALRRMQRLARRARLEPSEVKLLRGFLSAVDACSSAQHGQDDD